MSIDLETVKKIASLARITLSDEEADPLKGELNNILAWVEQLSEVDTDGVPAMTSAVETSLFQRPDEVADGGYAERVLANAPSAEFGYFAVPKVIE
ncbi:MAG: Asp-tRNA(Asn)/Glu-tRNA(Gln) amidotransferase subunit GatC [Pseudomonadota bacterium]